MKNTVMVGVVCGHSGENGICGGELGYYQENGRNKTDLYFCKGCYKLTQWNGKIAVPVGGVAYPNRNK